MVDPCQGSLSSVGSAVPSIQPCPLHTLFLALISLAENSHSHPLSPPLGRGSSVPSLPHFLSRLWAGKGPWSHRGDAAVTPSSQRKSWELQELLVLLREDTGKVSVGPLCQLGREKNCCWNWGSSHCSWGMEGAAGLSFPPGIS